MPFILSDEEAIEALCNRVDGFIDNNINYVKLLEISEEEKEKRINEYEIQRQLYHKYYERCLDNGVFDGINYSINDVVDNDYINYCDVISPSCEDWEELNKIYQEEGLGDICEYRLDYEYIEEELNGYFLVRY